jgi:myo-inositol-1(or 4)-monophosphatase
VSAGEQPQRGPAHTPSSGPAPATSQELLELAAQAARMAGALLKERARAGAEREISAKSTPTDLVSEADLASERAIRKLLRERRPDDGFLGEETGGAEQGASGLSWVVDPLDGTINFLFGIPQWCVSVAVRDNRGTVAGAVYDPNREELFTATREGPALLVGSGRAVELSRAAAGPADPALPGAGPAAARVAGGPAGAPSAAWAGGTPDDGLAGAMVATGLAYEADVRRAQARVLERLVPRVRDIRRFGSAALDLTWTAAGRYDAYFERSVKPWDIAAGALICERAGLEVSELPVHENLPWGILVAPPALAQPLLELVAGP